MARKTEDLPAAEAPVEVQTRSLFGRVADYLTGKDWSYTPYEEQGYFTFRLQVNDGSVRVVADVAEGEGWGRLLVLTFYPVYVPLQRRAAVAEALARINFVNIFGNLEMDMKDGELRVRTILESDGYVSEPMIERAMLKSVGLADQYFAPLLAIAFGNAAPQDVLEMARRGEGQTLQ
jgi:hypothetical protein